MKSATLTPAKSQRFVLYEADWRQYDALRRSLDERGQRAFVTFDGYQIELMSPSFEHDRASLLIAQLVRAFARATRTKFVSGGSTTFKRRELKHGLEPDQCFWIQNQAAIRGMKKIDLRVHPAPDLAVEVEVSRRLLDRQAIYARLGIPEIWIYDGKSFRIFALDDEKVYKPTQRSLSFPTIRFVGVERLLQRAATMDELEWEGHAARWVRSAITD